MIARLRFGIVAITVVALGSTACGQEKAGAKPAPGESPATQGEPKLPPPAPDPGESVDQGLSEGGREFNPELGLKVWVCGGSGEMASLGVTLAPEPLMIPKCRWWAVEPVKAMIWADLVAEAKAQGIRGLRLGDASDADLARLSLWPRLQTLVVACPRDRYATSTDDGLVHLRKLKELRALVLWRTHITDAGLVHIGKLDRLRWLELESSSVTDAGLVHLKECKGLRTLDLTGTKITDAGLAHLTELKELQTLNLGWTAVTDAELIHLKQLKGLQALNLGWGRITDAGLAHLKELKDLQTLKLEGTGITDAGLAHLKELGSLQWLDLHETRITDAALADLRKAPTLVIVKPHSER